MDEKEKNRFNAGEAKFHQVWQCALDGMRLTDGDGIIRDVNQAFCDLVRLPREALVNKPLSVIYRKDSDRIIQKHCERFRTRTIPKHVFNKYELHNGRVRWFEVHNTYVEIPGEPEQVLAIFRDKTAIKEASDKLKESEERLNIAVQSARIGLWDQDFVRGTVVRNDIWAEMLGYRPEEIESDKKAFMNLIHPEDRHRINRIIQDHEMGKTDYFRAEQRMRCRDGAWKWVLNAGRIVQRDESGKPLRAAGIHLDIDDQKKTEESLKRSEQMFHSIWDQSRDGMRLSDNKGRTIMVNQAFCNLIGKPKSELEGQSLGIIYAPKDQQRVVKRYKENFSNRTVQPYIERPFTLWDGSKKWFGVSIAFITDDLLLSVFRDITGRVHDQVHLKELVHQKETLMKELQHRIKNNLNIIASLISLEMRQIKDPELRDVFVNTRTRIQSMAAIYERFTFSADLNYVALDKYLNDLAKSILRTFTAGRKNIRLITSMDPVKIDTKRAVNLGLILNELLTNALKYAYPETREGDIAVELHQSGEEVCMSVADEGVGLPEDFSPQTADSMGMMLIQTLTCQLQGTVKIDTDHKTQFSIIFKL